MSDSQQQGDIAERSPSDAQDTYSVSQVTVAERALHDPRLKLASKLLEMSHESLGWRLISVWSLAMMRRSPLMHPALIGAALDRSASAVLDAFVLADLAKHIANDSLDLSPMQSLFGRWQWRVHIVDGTPTTGMRAQTTERPGEQEPHDTLKDKALRDRVLALLELGPRRRTELRKELRVRRASVLSVVNALLDEGLVVEADKHVIALAGGPRDENAKESLGADTQTGTESPESPAGSVPESGSNDLTQSPDNEPEFETLSSVPAAETDEEPGTGTPESVTFAALDSDELVPPGRRRDVARRLWTYQNQCRAKLDPDAPPLLLSESPGGSLDAVILALSTYSPRRCRHALDVFAAAGAHIGRSGGNSLQYLNGRTNWRREHLERAIAMTIAEVETSGD